jgi:predicted enzyme related to lactoylglutathione lyase
MSGFQTRLRCITFSIPKIYYMKNAISWFEIPTADLARAQKFYETIFQVSLIPMDFPAMQMRMFPVDDPTNPHAVSGALAYAPDFYKPIDNGTLVYLNANPDVQLVLDRVEAAGGKVLVPKTHISEEIGHMGVFIDSEGNRVAVHSVPPGFKG